MLSSKSEDGIGQSYEEHSRLDSERFPEVVTNDSHGNVSIKVNIQESTISYVSTHIRI